MAVRGRKAARKISSPLNGRQGMAEMTIPQPRDVSRIIMTAKPAISPKVAGV